MERVVAGHLRGLVDPASTLGTPNAFPLADHSRIPPRIGAGAKFMLCDFEAVRLNSLRDIPRDID